VAKRYILPQLSEEVNRKLPARNTTIQLLTLYTDPDLHNAQRYRRTDRQTDGVMMPIADHILCTVSKKEGYIVIVTFNPESAIDGKLCLNLMGRHASI